MAKKTAHKRKQTPVKYNQVNLLYFFWVSSLVLLAVFLSNFTVFFQLEPLKPYVLQQVPSEPNYTLEPTLVSITLLPNESEEVDVLLKDEQGNVVLDQSDIYYEWETDSPSAITVTDNGFEENCPYDIQSPCPNLHAQIEAKKAGNAVVIVNTYILSNDNLIASTTIDVEVSSIQFTTKYQVKFKGLISSDINQDQLMLISGSNVDLPEDCNQFSRDNNPGKLIGNGIYEGQFDLDSCFTSSGFQFCVKGPRHVKKCFDNITLGNDEIVNLTSVPLVPGDLNLPQNGVVDQQDLFYLWQHKDSSMNSELLIGDLNLDGIINMGDVSLLLQALNLHDD